MFGDFLAIVSAFILSYILRVSLDARPLINQVTSTEYLHIFLLLLPFWLLIFGLLGLYRQAVYEKRFSEYPRLLVGAFIGILFLIGYDFVSGKHIFPARLVPVYAFLLSYGMLLVFRIFARGVRDIMLQHGIGISNTLLVGSTQATGELLDALTPSNISGFRVVGIVSQNNHDQSKIRHFADFDEAIKKIGLDKLNCIIQTQLYDNEETNRHVLETAQTHHIAYRFIPSNDFLFTANNEVDLFRGFPVVAVHQTALIGWGRVLKRFFDFLVGWLILIIFSPIMLLIAVAIKLTTRGPVLLRQTRLTRFDQEFTVFKFVTVKREYNNLSPEQAFKKMGKPELIDTYRSNGDYIENDPRITPIGRFLRRSSLDELPQLFNVAKGDISLVGPRALVPDELRKHPRHHAILSVKSGLTGLAQVSGRRNISFEERRQLDIFYVQHWSFWLDIVILLKTLRIVFNRQGAK